MTRFILRIFGIKDFESCQSCINLKEQLVFERSEKTRLIDTLIQIIKPKEVEAAPIEVNQIQSSSALFSKRRAAAEQRDREEARILRNSTNLGKPDRNNLGGIEKLEQELGIEAPDLKGAEEGV